MAAIIAKNTLVLAPTLIDTATSAAINLTGTTVVCKVVDATGVDLTLPATITNAVAGQVSATLTPTQTTNPGIYRYSCRITFTDGTTTETESSVFVVERALF